MPICFNQSEIGEEGTTQQVLSSSTHAHPSSHFQGHGGVINTCSESMPCEQVGWVAHHALDGRT